MAELTFKKYLAGFNSIRAVAASVSVLIPGFAYFTRYAPPLGEMTWLTAAFALATIFITYYYSPKSLDTQTAVGRFPPLIRLAVKVLVISIGAMVLYAVLIDMCTVTIAGTNKRIQIGFDKFNWSLTEYGKKVKTEDPDSQPADWLSEESYKTGVAKLFWHTWSIYMAGILLILVFVSTFVMWAFGWSLIARQNAMDQTND